MAWTQKNNRPGGAPNKMPIPIKYAKKEEIPAAVVGAYVEKGGEWVLDVPDVDQLPKLHEFRANNIELLKLTGAKDMVEAKAKLEKLKDVDPDKYAAIVAEQKKAEREAAEKEGKLKEYYEAEHKKAAVAAATALDESVQKNKALQTELETLLIDNAIVEACTKKGVRPEAIIDVTLRGKQVFKLEGKTPVAYGPGGIKLFNKKAEPLSIEQWLEERLADNCKHWALPNAGGGGGGGGRLPGHSGANPYSKATRNMTQQAVLERDNPQLAEQLRATAVN